MSPDIYNMYFNFEHTKSRQYSNCHIRDTLMTKLSEHSGIIIAPTTFWAHIDI